MADSTNRYFQLTPSILVEYTYNNLTGINNQAGNASDHIIDLGNSGYIINNGYCSTRTFLWEPDEKTFVLPVNKSESRFRKVDIDKIRVPNNEFGIGYSFTSEGNEDYDDDILVDRFKLHFTSRNFFGSYDGFIIAVYTYDKAKNKIGLLSQYIKKTDDPQINENPVLINQKLYTTYKEFVIPNLTAITEYEKLGYKMPGNKNLTEQLSPKYGIMDNAPLMMSIYGVKSTYENTGNENYVTEIINTIYIPITDKSNRLSVSLVEATDGDYFKIYPIVDNNTVSFSDYISHLSDGHPEQYIVFYELTLTEWYTTAISTVPVKDITHREQFIINAAQYVDDNGDTVLEINENELDRIMYYRPVIRHSGSLDSFTIDVKLNIVNTFDNTTIVKSTSITLSEHSGQNPKKYGKKMDRIYLGEIPAQVNVYNKKPDLDRDGVRITNSSSNVKIENHQHSYIGFIECANVGVSIEQVPKELLQG